MTTDYTAWIGSTESSEEMIGLGPALAAAATFDDSETKFAVGGPLPPLWHWFYFVPRAPQSRLSPDGHPQRGGFMPPIELPRRMFAGARLRFEQPLTIGRPATRNAVIRSVSQKDGKTGKLAFVTVGYTITQDGHVCAEEEQDIVYREPGSPVAAPEPRELPPLPANAWIRTITPDPTLLFRFSALTFNAHRIHYDREYATQVEGYPGLVVHGPLSAMLLMELLRLNAQRPVSAFSFRGQSPLFDLAPFRVIGTPEVGGNKVQLEAQGPDGKTALAASAELG